MTTEDFMALWCDTDLRKYIGDLAHAFSRNTDHQSTLRAKAWIAVCDSMDGKTEEHYMAVAYSAMRRYYQTYQMEEPRNGRRRSADPGIRRANRKLKSYI